LTGERVDACVCFDAPSLARGGINAAYQQT
jgi:hypothetical protein